MAATATASSTGRATGRNAIPTSPSNAPTAAPPARLPTMCAVTVRTHRLPLVRSPSGWMLESIDTPHGDQAERTAAATATRQAPTTTISGTSAVPLRLGHRGHGGCPWRRLVLRPGPNLGPRRRTAGGCLVQAGMARPDAGGQQLGVDRRLA